MPPTPAASLREAGARGGAEPEDIPLTPIHRYLLLLLILAAPALAADVTVELDSASGFVIQNNGASVQAQLMELPVGGGCLRGPPTT